MSLEIVSKIRAKYPTPLAATHAKFLLEVAGELHKGLLRKDYGTFIRLPDGTGVAQDIVMDPDGHVWDILIDGDSTASPSWNSIGTVEASRFYAVAPQAPPAPDPVPPTTCPQAADIAALQLKLTALESYVDEWVERETGNAKALLTYLQTTSARLAKLESPRVIRTEKGGGLFSHSHEVKL